ncbi:MAG: ATP synthase F1 subunit delta [Nitrospirae bacterium]|nr:MAG: ATP synthase F1 subunit delta [Nitrospirota bacterium]
MASEAAELYARVLLDLADEAGATEAVAGEVGRIDGLFAETPGLSRFFASPVQALEAKEGIVAEMVRGLELSDLMRRFLGVLLKNRRLDLFPEIAAAFREAFDERRGVARVEVETALPLEAAEEAEVAERLGSRLGREVELEVAVQPDLIGGLVVRVDSEEIDGSVRGRLKGLRAHLLAG